MDAGVEWTHRVSLAESPSRRVPASCLRRRREPAQVVDGVLDVQALSVTAVDVSIMWIAAYELWVLGQVWTVAAGELGAAHSNGT